MRREAAEAKVARAQATGRPLMSYDPDAHGRGAAENAVRSLRFYFRYAKSAGYITDDPSLMLEAPSRAQAPERPLTTEELADIWRGALLGSNDLELDELILTLVRHTGARREGCINLCLAHLNTRRRSITLSEKGGKVRELPLRLDLLERLKDHATGRGAQAPGDKVLLQRSGRGITRKRFETMFNRVDANCDWTEILDVGIHWIRHTTLSDIASVSGLRVASDYAGHSEKELGVIGIYTKPSFDDLVDAYEAVLGARG